MAYREVLPLYRPTPSTLQATPYDSECDRCQVTSKTRCLAPDGAPNGILVVGAQVGRVEEANKRHFASPTGQFVRDTLQRFSSEPLAFDSGVRCVGGEVEKCSSYTLHTISTYKPKRIICVSEGAALAVLGRSHAEGAIKRWYGYFNGIPVFVVPDALRASRNRFLKAQFVEDVQWALTTVPMPDPKDLTCSVPSNLEETEQAVKEATAAGVPVAVDCEWAGNSENENFRLISIALAVDDKSWVWEEKILASERVSAPLRQFFLSSHPKVGHHAKADIRSLWSWLGQSPNEFNLDTRLMWKVQAPEADGGLDACADMVGMGGHKTEAKKALEKAVKTVRKLAAPTNMFDKLPPDAAENPYAYAFAYIPRDTLLRYNALDTVATHRLWREMVKRLETQPVLQRTLKRTVMPASLALAQVEKWGVLIDKDALDTYSKFLTQRVEEVKAKLATYGEFNPASGPELADLLYKKLKLKVPFKTDSGKPSTDKDALAEIAKVHPIGADLLEFRKVTKHLGTYAVGLRGCIADDGRIHAFYNTDGTETGRLSCSQPNLQQVARPDTIEGKMSRDLFIAGPGKVLVQADYSQLELRVAAAMSGDEKMIEVFNSGVDYHLRTAQLISRIAWGIAPEQVEKKHRTAAKSCIAEGQKVLTSNGIKNIQDVALSDLVWDGVEWVTHGGVIYNGTREVIEYDGLRATPDHIVFTEDGYELPFGRVAAEHRRLAVTAIDDNTVRYSDVSPSLGSEGEAQVCQGNVFNVSTRQTCVCVQRTQREDDYLSVHESKASVGGRQLSVRGPESTHTGGTVRCNSPTNSHANLPRVCGLRRQGNKELVCWESGLRSVLSEGVASSDVQESSDRPHRQSWSLRAGEPSACSSNRESKEHAQEQVLRVQWAASDLCRPLALAEDGLPKLQLGSRQDNDACVCRCSCREHPCEDSPKVVVEKVYDILNAGPRHRFTVSGKLVHNCNFGLLYGRGDSALAEQMGSTREEAAKVRSSVLGNFRKLAADIESSVRAAKLTGEVWTLWDGQPSRRRSMVGIADADDGLRAAAERQSYNTRVQGSASDLCLSSVAQIVKWILDDCVPAKLVMTVHDSIMVECDAAVQDEVMYQMKRIMESQPCGGVPIVVDIEVGTAWGSMEKVK